jgi:hypothetical protein
MFIALWSCSRDDCFVTRLCTQALFDSLARAARRGIVQRWQSCLHLNIMGDIEKQVQTVRVDTLPNEKLDYLGKQLEVELGRLHQSAGILRSLAQEYQTSGTAVQELKDLEDGAACLFPRVPAHVLPHCQTKQCLH